MIIIQEIGQVQLAIRENFHSNKIIREKMPVCYIFKTIYINHQKENKKL